MSAISVILVVIVAFLAGMEGVLDQYEFHQPLVACTLIGLVTGHLKEGVMLGGSLQLMALGWANIGAAVAPDAALASVASAIIMVLGLNGGTTDTTTAISTAIAVAIPLSVAGLFLTMLCRTLAIPVVHFMDGAAEKGDFGAIERWQIVGICLQGIRIAIPAAALCFVPSTVVTSVLNAMPAWLSGGMTVGGGMVAAVGYAMVINMMATKETWPFFALGFVFACVSEFTLIGLVTGHLKEGVMLGGSLQLMALGWANIGAAVAPDAALASVASAIIMVLGLNGGTTDTTTAISTAIAVAIPLSVAGLFLTMICRTIAIPIVHFMDAAAEKGDFGAIERWQIVGICLQGVRIAIPAAALCFVPSSVVTGVLNAMPAWLSGGMTVGGGMVAAVGYAMVINMMATKETWPFFALGFVFACVSEFTLIALGVIGVVIAIVYLGLKDAAKNNGGGSNTGSGDPLGDILNDY